MNTKFFTAFAIMAAIAGLGSKVYAQSSNAGNQTIDGDSLTGIDNRTAEDDFARFFGNINPGNNISRNAVQDNTYQFDNWQIGDQIQLRRNDPITTPNNVIFPQGDESFYNNDGVQVQLNLGNNR